MERVQSIWIAGYTTMARAFAASEVRLDQDRAALTAARVDPRIVLDGAFPRLIDEYQLVDGLWEAVRGRIDELRRKGTVPPHRLGHPGRGASAAYGCAPHRSGVHAHHDLS